MEDLNSLEDGNLDDLNNNVKGTLDEMGTFEDLNNLSDKFDKWETTGIEDTNAVDQKSSCEDVNLDETTEGIDQKDSCEDVNLEGIMCQRMQQWILLWRGHWLYGMWLRSWCIGSTHLIWYVLKRIQ